MVAERWDEPDRPFPFDPQQPALPEARRALRGTEDLGKVPLAAAGRRLHMRRYLGSLEPNAAEGGAIRWTFVDSLARPVATVERLPDGWEVRDPDTGEPLYRDFSLDPRQFEVQGRACMAGDPLEDAHVLVKFRANDPSSLPPGSSMVPFGFAGFVPREAVPVADARGRPLRPRIDEYETGCGGSSLSVLSTGPLGDTGFKSSQRFLGSDGIARTLATYNAKAPYDGARYVMANTTAVFGGGVIRAVVRSSDLFERLDEIGYADPNLPEGVEPLVRWVYGRVAGTPIHGWVPVRAEVAAKAPGEGGEPEEEVPRVAARRFRPSAAEEPLPAAVSEHRGEPAPREAAPAPPAAASLPAAELAARVERLVELRAKLAAELERRGD